MFDTIILWPEVCLEYICPNKQLNIKLVQYFQPKFVRICLICLCFMLHHFMCGENPCVCSPLDMETDKKQAC